MKGKGHKLDAAHRHWVREWWIALQPRKSDDPPPKDVISRRKGAGSLRRNGASCEHGHPGLIKPASFWRRWQSTSIV